MGDSVKMKNLQLPRMLFTLAAITSPIVALAQGPEAAPKADNGNTLTIVLGAFLVIALIVILVMMNKNRNPDAAAVVKGPVDKSEEEGTMVRMVGHRLIRLHGGVKVGSEMPIISNVTIGRDPTCTLSLADVELSSQHAEVRIDGTGAYAIDKGSTNGTTVNGDKLTPGVPHPLRDGDMIRLGSTELLYKSA